MKEVLLTKHDNSMEVNVNVAKQNLIAEYFSASTHPNCPLSSAI